MAQPQLPTMRSIFPATRKSGTPAASASHSRGQLQSRCGLFQQGLGLRVRHTAHSEGLLLAGCQRALGQNHPSEYRPSTARCSTRV